MKGKKKLNNIERELIEGLEGFVKDLEEDVRLLRSIPAVEWCWICNQCPIRASRVLATRKLLRVSQVLFAQFLGVSPKTVRAWEQGRSEPKDIACRFMDEIQRNPDYYRERSCGVCENAEV